MMDITLDNYEIWLVDYVDGTLSNDDRAKVEAFLLLHDDLREEAEALDIRLPKADAIRFPHHESLKRTPSQEIEDYYAIAAAEKCATPEDQETIRRYMMSPLFCAKVEDYKRLQLTPDASIKYPHKNRLKRHAVLPLWTSVASAAAVIAFICINLVIKEPTTYPTALQPQVAAIHTSENTSEMPPQTICEEESEPSTGSTTVRHAAVIAESSDTESHVEIKRISAIESIPQRVALCEIEKRSVPTIVAINKKLTDNQSYESSSRFETTNIFSAAIATSERIYSRISNTDYSKILPQKKSKL